MGTEYQSIRITEDQAAKIVQDLYGIQGKVSPLPGEIDFNFRIISSSGSYLLKVSRPEADIEHLEYQQALLNHVSAFGEGFESPTIIKNLHGKQLSEIKDEAGRSRKVRMLSWIEGRLWSAHNPVTKPLLFSLGAMAGNLTKTLQRFDHPKAHRRFEWDLAQSGWTADYLHLFSIEQQSIVAYFQDQFSSYQEEYHRLRKGIVHNDANDNNIILTHDLIEPRVKAIIDYGDVIHTQVINDLAVTIAYAIMGKPDPLSAAVPVVEGYNSEFPLQESELDFLYNLVARANGTRDQRKFLVIV